MAVSGQPTFKQEILVILLQTTLNEKNIKIKGENIRVADIQSIFAILKLWCDRVCTSFITGIVKIFHSLNFDTLKSPKNQVNLISH